jgi:hypothetical protein
MSLFFFFLSCSFSIFLGLATDVVCPCFEGGKAFIRQQCRRSGDVDCLFISEISTLLCNGFDKDNNPVEDKHEFAVDPMNYRCNYRAKSCTPPSTTFVTDIVHEDLSQEEVDKCLADINDARAPECLDCDEEACAAVDWQCGQPHRVCGNTGPLNLCLCDDDVNGNAVCWADQSCDLVPSCTVGGSECAADEVCVSSCCSGLKCFPICPDDPSPVVRRLQTEGGCTGGECNVDDGNVHPLDTKIKPNDYNINFLSLYVGSITTFAVMLLCVGGLLVWFYFKQIGSKKQEKVCYDFVDSQSDPN